MLSKIILLTLIPAFAWSASLRELNAMKAPFTVPDLPYATGDLAPTIDQQTMELHHGKHHKAYVDKLKDALGDKKSDSLVTILKNIKSAPTAVRNNAGGHWNHSFFWTVMIKDSSKTKMSKDLQKDIEKNFGSVDKFKEQFENKAKDLFGSGWVWLIKNDKGQLQIVATINQDNPLMDVSTEPGQPILGLDVWEHAYYLTYQNRRIDYIKNFWKIVNWDQVSRYYKEKI